jgi:hypothetical protein
MTAQGFRVIDIHWQCVNEKEWRRLANQMNALIAPILWQAEIP